MRKKLSRILSCILTSVLLASCVATLCAGTKKRETIKVGWYPISNYMETTTNEKGEKEYSGYSYEYLKTVSQYTGWDYEFVEGGFGELYAMLERGEIDVLGNLTVTAEREMLFNSSEYSAGNDHISICVKNDSDIAYNDYKAFDGMRIAVVADIHAEELRKYAEKNGFNYTEVRVDSMNDALKMLEEGKVDAEARGGYSYDDETRSVADFYRMPFKFYFSKNRPELAVQYSDAVNKILIIDSSFNEKLKQKYIKSTGDSFVLSMDEEECLKNASPLTVLYVGNAYPLMYYNADDEADGIVRDIFDLISERSGLEFEYVDRKYEGRIDIIPLYEGDFSSADKQGYALTNSYLDIPYSYVRRNGSASGATMAIRDIGTWRDNELNSEYELVEYSTAEECLDAVKNGNVDQAMINSYSAVSMLKSSKYSMLYSVSTLSNSRAGCIAVNSELDKEVYSIINKAAAYIDESLKKEIIAYNVIESRKLDARLVIDQTPNEVIIGVAVLIIIGFVVIFFRVFSLKNERIRNQRRREMELFLSYVYLSNDEVSEQDNEKKERFVFKYVNGEIVKEKAAFFCIDQLEKYLHPDDIEIVREHLDRTWDKGKFDELEKIVFDCRIMRDDICAYRWTRFLIQRMKQDENHPDSYMIYQKNIDGVKEDDAKREQILKDALYVAQNASKAKGDFMSKMSHEIRTPLNAIIGYLTIAKRSGNNIEKFSECLAKSEIAATHLLGVINDVLDISMIESGKMKIVNSRFDFKELVQSLATMFSEQAQEKNISLEVVLDGIEKEILIGDRLRVSQVLTNIISNAVKFTGENGRVYILIQQNIISKDKMHIRFSVSDTGIGMSEEFLDKIFDPFEQQNGEIAQNYGGTGLGLSITRNLITMMNGSIEVESVPGEGTTFVVDIPFEYSDDEQRIVGSHSFADIRVIFCDKDEISLKYAGDILDRCGIRNDLVSDMEKAIDAIVVSERENDPYDICFLEWDGGRGVQTIRDIYGGKLPIIIYISSGGDISDEVKRTGASAMITKPLFQSTIFDTLVVALSKYHKKSLKEIKYDFGGKHLLLVEDNKMNVEIARELLEREGFEVICAYNGEEALNLFKNSEKGYFSVILMDVQMPVMNGYDATIKIRNSAHPDATKIPIIAMTANAFAEDISHSMASGMNNHVSKPVDFDQLYALINDYIR